MLKWLWISGLVVVLDQTTKYAVNHLLTLHEQIPIVQGFNLILAYNEGAAFSFLADAGGWQRWFFTALALIISVVLMVMLKQLASHKRAEALALSLVLGGAIGNVIDRIIYGYVIDFIDVYYTPYHWPAFNVADAAISLGVVILLLDMPMNRKASP